MSLKIWGRRNSFNVQKVMWLVGELDIAHTHIPAGGSFGQLNEPAFLTMNPHGRVPVIDDAGTIFTGEWIFNRLPAPGEHQPADNIPLCTDQDLLWPVLQSRYQN
ncbi:hypothetical protein HB779_22190 (plasmid) [Phyllobacterium sp. 628]|nr:hypothetical protein HB779_22190 [Phyllobacterium sp. 628]